MTAPNSIDWGATAQMLTAIAAIIAIGLGPFLSFRVSQRAAVSQFRQAWLDGLRNDLSEIIALHEEVVAQRTRAEYEGASEPAGSEMMQIGNLRARIRMRLNVQRKSHAALMAAVNAFITCYDAADDDFRPTKVMQAFDPVKREVWDDVKSGRV